MYLCILYGKKNKRGVGMSKEALLVSLDSDLGKHMKRVLEEEGYTVTSTSRHGLPDTVHFELTQDVPAFPKQHFDIVVFNLGVSQVNRTRVETIRLNAILPCDALGIFAESVKIGGRLVVFSSGWGSLQQTLKSGETHEITYRMSKAALNIGIAVLSNKYKDRHWIVMQPGFITTKMNTNPKGLPSVDPYQAMSGVFKTSMSIKDRYAYVDYLGNKQ
jgi:hypothetical protein